VEFKKDILGVGLDSDECGHSPEKFRGVFFRAREIGYRLTMHCDVDQIDSLKNIEQVLDIGVDRIDHGVNVVYSTEMMDVMAKRPEMGLTVCPISNSYVVGNMCEERILKLMDAGVKITINSDDPSYMGEQYVEENLIALQKSMDLTKEQLAMFQKNAVDICWADQSTKDRLRREIDTYLERSQ